MMTEEKRIEWLLELQEHPEQLTDEQLQQILADDEMRQLVQQLGFAKRAFKHDALKNDTPDVEGEWEKFAASHSEELEILDEGEYKPRLWGRFTAFQAILNGYAPFFKPFSSRFQTPK